MIKIWNQNDGILKRTWNYHTGSVSALKTLPNGDLVIGSDDMKIKIWNPNDWKLRRTLEGHTRWVFALTTLKNGDIVSGSND